MVDYQLIEIEHGQEKEKYSTPRTLGKRWTLMILRYLSGKRAVRYSEIKRTLTSISGTVLYDLSYMSAQQQKQEIEQQFVDVADINDVPAGKMKHVEVGEKEILLANSEGRVYALCDRCSHMNAPLSMGALNGKVVTCPMHGARFDVTTGKKIAEPMALDPSKFPEPLPEGLQKMFAHAAQIQSKLKAYDQETYETRVEDRRIKVRIEYNLAIK